MSARRFDICEAKARLSKSVDASAAGEEIILVRNGRPLARLIAYQRIRRLRARSWFRNRPGLGGFRRFRRTAGGRTHTFDSGGLPVRSESIRRRENCQALGKSPQDYIPLQIARQSIGTLRVTVAHAAATATLPVFHSDPFDRILVAQAVCEGMTLVTADRAVASYAVAQLHV
jgi:prevent-host-death family protein